MAERLRRWARILEGSIGVGSNPARDNLFRFFLLFMFFFFTFNKTYAQGLGAKEEEEEVSLRIEKVIKKSPYQS